MTRRLVEIRYGSQLYGTATPASDLDLKSVVVPEARLILLQRAPASVQDHRAKAPGERNTAGDVDREAIALHRFLALLAEGQPMAIEMLFAPRAAMTGDPDPLWAEIRACRDRLLTRDAESFLGYCRAQANRFAIRGSRLAAIRAIVAWFDQAIARHGRDARLGDAAGDLPAFIAAERLAHTAIVEIPDVRGLPLRHLDCCNRKAPFTASLKEARAIWARLVDGYGGRAKQVESEGGIDWKALSHAVRIGREAVDYLATGRLEFPLPYAAHLLAIRRAELAFEAVADEIERLLAEAEAAASASPLPEAADQGLIDDLVCHAYGAAVAAGDWPLPAP